MGKAMKIDIAAMSIGAKPPGFTERLTGQGDPVRWQVLADDSAPGGRVIAETSRDTADYLTGRQWPCSGSAPAMSLSRSRCRSSMRYSIARSTRRAAWSTD
jgi:hypothetical protein